MHQDLWKIADGIRTYLIMSEVDKALNEKNIEGLTGFQLSYVKHDPIPSVNTKYAGMGIVYEKVEIGNLNCSVEEEYY